jgi:hypothetical protein
MRQFKSLKPEKLPGDFDASIHGEEPIVEVNESPARIIVSYTFPGFYLIDDSRKVKDTQIEFKHVHIASTGFVTESGKPLLPSFGRYVQIPHNCSYEVTVVKGNAVQFENVHVSPAQEELTDSPGRKHDFEYDQATYSEETLYPRNMIVVTGPLDIDEYQALLIHVCPLQYNPAKKTLIGYGNVTVTINLKRKKGEQDSPTHMGSEVDREAFGNLFLNPARRIDERLAVDTGTIVIKPKGPEFLIIYAKIFETAATKLAAWKNRRGLVTETVSIDVIGNDITNMKTYIRSRRKALGSRLRYVLLFGDVDTIPSQVIPESPPEDNLTDYYYSTETDAPSGNFVLPWLSVGRIPIQKAADALGVVDQIIAYEKNPPADPNYYRRMVAAAYFQDWDSDHKEDRAYLQTIEGIRSYLVSLGLDVERVYVSDANPQFYIDGTPVPADVKAAIVSGPTATQMLIDATTEGQLMIGHRDHGDVDGWSEPSFTIAHLDSVTGDMPTLFYSINCLTGRFDSKTPKECFAEKNLRMKGTAPSLIAATRVSGTWLNNYLIKAIFDATFGGLLPTFPGGTASYPIKNGRLGDILNYAKSYLPVASTGAAAIRDHFEIYHILGDPTLEIWKEAPHIVKIKAAMKLKVLDIQLSECPKGSVLTIWYGPKLLKKLEPSSTHITIPLKGLISPPVPPIGPVKPAIFVCFWAPGCRYSELKVGLG